MTEPIRQRIPLSVSDARAVLRCKGTGQDEGHGGNRHAAHAGALGQVPRDPGPAAMRATRSGFRPRGLVSNARGRSRVKPEASMSHGLTVAADQGPRHGGGAVPAPGSLS